MSVPGLSDSLLTSLGQVRKAYPQITYEGIDVSSTFQPSLVDFVYKEGFGDHQMADTLEITLADPEGLFRKSWSLSTGQTVSASIIVENWNGPFTGTLAKPLGSMYIKSVRIQQNKSGGTTVRISCTSISPEISFRLERKTRAWTQTTVNDVVNQIATDNHLTPRYTPSTNPQMERVDQHDHSDAYMVQKISSDNDYSFKVVNNSLWVRDRHAVEQSAPVGTIICPSPQTGPGGLNGSGVESWEFIESTEDCNYSQCDLTYKDNTTGDNLSATGVGSGLPAPHLKYHNDPRTGVPQATDNITLE
jgi:hypothetical protein